MRMLSIQKLSLCVLICLMLSPFVASALGSGESLIYEVEIIALISWYVASFTMPLILKELDTVFVLWYITFVLVGIAIGSDLVYRIRPDKQLVWPDKWYDMLGNLRSHFYWFLETWVILMVPGCVLFIIMLFGRRVYLKSEEAT
jgi:hypothetical protein